MAQKYKKRSDGRYLVQVQKGIKPDGKPDYKNIYGRTIAELEKKEREFRAELDKGIVVDDQGLTVGVWAEKWLETYKSNREHNTIVMYKVMINAHIIPAIGHYKLKDLRAHHIQGLLNEKTSNGQFRTAEKIKITINQILEQALKNEFIFKNVCKSVEMPKKKKTVKRSLSAEEKGFISQAGFSLKECAFIYTLLYTGLRRGEILALTQNDIDFSKKHISVCKAIVFNGNKAVLKNSPKSAAGQRNVPMPDILISALKEYCAALDTLILFPSAKKEYMSQTYFNTLWSNAMKKINLAAGGKVERSESGRKIKTVSLASDITPHIFRHTYATSLYYAGIDIKMAQYLLGHSSIYMTMDIYTHLSADNNDNTLEKLNLFVNGGNNQSSLSQ